MYFEPNKKYIILDIEGNSASKESERRITQFSALVIYNDKIEEINWMNRNVNYISSFVSKMTHITLKKCKLNGFSERNLVSKIHELLSSCDCIYAYGCDFDKRILHFMFSKYQLTQLDVNWHDVIDEVKKYLPVSKSKLSIAASELGFENQNFHNALVDCYATLFLMEKIEEAITL